MAGEEKGKKRGFFSRLFGGGRTELPEEVAHTPTEEDVEEMVAAAPEEPAEETPAAPPTAPAIEKFVAVEAPAAPPAPVEEPAAPQVTPEEEKQGFFARLKQRLGKTKTGLVERVKQVISFYGTIDEELLEEIEIVLVQSDVGIETTQKILDEVRRNREARKIENPQELVPLIKESILRIVSHSERTLKLQPKRPTVMLVIGVNGVGKTTTIGKLAEQYRKQGKKVLLVAGDTFRAAAVEQLTIWAERTGSDIVKQAMGADPAAVVFDALSGPNIRSYDVVMIDTAGRLHTKSNLMEELRKIHRVIQKVMPEAPHETLLILDATTGQNALSQAKLFHETTQLSGLIMTKLDGTAKGGILIALRDLFDVPVLKIGIGEGEEDLRDFDAQAFVDALFES